MKTRTLINHHLYVNFQAGIDRHKLSIALEPEAASAYCRYLPMDKTKTRTDLYSLPPGTKYMILDAGGIN
jgi:hypothetical protein